MSQGKKLFTNKTSTPLDITLYIRAGDDPSHAAGTEIFNLPANGSKEVTYGTDTNSVFLNGMELRWGTNGSTNHDQQMVAVRGSQFDSLLNTNSKITINSIGALGLAGSN